MEGGVKLPRLKIEQLEGKEPVKQKKKKKYAKHNVSMTKLNEYLDENLQIPLCANKTSSLDLLNPNKPVFKAQRKSVALVNEVDRKSSRKLIAATLIDISDLSIPNLPILTPHEKNSPKISKPSLSRNKLMSISMPTLPELPSITNSALKPFKPAGNFKYLKNLKCNNVELNQDIQEHKRDQSNENVNDTLNDIIKKCNQVEEDNKCMKDVLVHSRANDLQKFHTQFNKIHKQLYGPSDEELYAFMKLNNPKIKLKIDQEIEKVYDESQNERHANSLEEKLIMQNEKDRAEYKVSYDYSRYLKRRAAQLHERIRRKRVLRTLDHDHPNIKNIKNN